MISELTDLFGSWIAAVVTAVHFVAARVRSQPRILFVERDPDNFTARIAATRKGPILPEASFHLLHGRLEPALTAEWRAALRGSHIDISMRPDRVLFRAVDFPKQATDFLDGMIRAQIDRLTPWPASEVEFGTTSPVPVGGERVALTVAATSKQKILPLLRIAADFGAASVAGLVDEPEVAAEPIKLFDRALTGGASASIDVARMLRMMLLGGAVAAAASLAISAYVGGWLDAEQQGLQLRIVQRRAALRLSEPGGSAETLLAKRKQAQPSSVMVLEEISRVLPDTTYVTELRVEADKMQVIGLTQDAPSLIRLIEQSPQFARATFFAPTTRSQSDPGERFHIEAHIAPYFGSGS
jgi:general secretion pathway protein L